MTDTAASPVRTRFAPSPTGYMHIGGMRTALFCWLWARHTGGTFILRIDDTDQERNVEAALEPIFRAFRWLGLDWDEGPDKGGEFGPYYQSQRSHLYQAAVEKLIAEGKAFRDFDPPEVTQADRQAAEAEKRNYLNVRRSLELSDEQVRQNLAEGKPYVVRFLVPRDEKVAIDDAVRGHVEWDCGQMPDPVLMRSNGSFLYNFATVVDDAHMGITHIIRAEEHLANTPVQALLHRALGNPLPVFAHIPFITAPGSTKKMSKRDVDKLRNSPALKKMFDRADEVFPKLGLGDSKTLNPVMVGYYEKLGYLPAAILNALSRLGWSLDDKTEIMSLETVVEHFTLDRIVKSSASFDPDKLLATEAHWMAALPLEQKIAGCVPYLRQVGWFDDTSDALRLASIVAAVGDRLKVFSDILDYAEFFTADDALTYDAKALAKLQATAGARDLLEKTRQLLADTTLFDAPSLDSAVHQFVEREGIKIGQIVGPLRLAATGRTSGVGLFDALAIIGREGVLKRLDVLAARLPAA